MSRVSTRRAASGLLVVTVDAPPMNLYDEIMHRELREAIGRGAESDIAAVIFEARGRVFTGGVDLGYLDRLGGPSAAETLFTEMLEMIEELEALNVPTVLAAHATCLTWGFELALACDLIVAAAGVRFGMVERRFAITPAMGGTQRLAARAGIGRAKQMALTGALFDAAELARWNVVNVVLPDEDFAAAARSYADELAAGPAGSHRAAKAILRQFSRGGLDAADAATPSIAAPLHASPDHERLVTEFLHRRREGT